MSGKRGTILCDWRGESGKEKRCRMRVWLASEHAYPTRRRITMAQEHNKIGREVGAEKDEYEDEDDEEEEKAEGGRRKERQLRESNTTDVREKRFDGEPFDILH
eukprot:8052895-Pyramimonas_sp.AAC.1